LAALQQKPKSFSAVLQSVRPEVKKRRGLDCKSQKPEKQGEGVRGCREEEKKIKVKAHGEVAFKDAGKRRVI